MRAVTTSQVIDQEPGRSDFSASDCKYFAGLLTDLGKRTSDIGIPLVYLNHLNSVSERPEGLVRPKRLEDFAELGRGDVNIPGVFVALRQIKILGWAIVELDGENDKSRTPKESAEISKGILRRN